MKPDLSVVIGANTALFDAGMAKVDRSLKSTARGGDQLAMRMTSLATKITAVTAGVGLLVGALVSMARHTTASLKEIRDLSNIAGVSAERFQTLTYAANEVGVSQEKLSDILKDVNDKMGDFLQTGAGPMKDFFEQIGPKVGVTADQFRNLNSADALQLYVSSLEKANLSQAEMTFYLEAIANDATALIPILANNGAEMRNLEQAARDLGVVIGDDLVERTARMERVWGTMVDNMNRRFLTFAANVLAGLDTIFGISEEGQANVLARERSSLEAEAKMLQAQMDGTGEQLSRRDGGVGFGTPPAVRERIDEIGAEIARIDMENQDLTEALMRRRRIADAFDPKDLPGSPEVPAAGGSSGRSSSGGGGARRATEEAVAGIDRVTEATERASRVSQAAENAATNFLQTIITKSGSARDALATLASQMAQVLAQEAASSIFSGVGMAIGGPAGGIIGSLFGGRANGGGVQAGTPYVVNERTPNSEIFVPSDSGAILNVAQAQQSLSQAARGGGAASGSVAVRIMLDDAILDARIEQVSGPVAATHARQTVEGYNERVAPARQRQIKADPRRMG